MIGNLLCGGVAGGIAARIFVVLREIVETDQTFETLHAAFPTPPVRTSEMPPVRPKLQTVSTNDALYFADSAAVRMFMRNKGPFDRINAQGVASLNDKP